MLVNPLFAKLIMELPLILGPPLLTILIPPPLFIVPSTFKGAMIKHMLKKL